MQSPRMLALLLAALLLTGCLAPGERVEIVSETEFIPLGLSEPYTLEVTVFVRGTGTVHLDALLVNGLTVADTVSIDEIALDLTLDATRAGVHTDPIAVVVHPQDLAEQSVTHVQVLLAGHTGAELRLELKESEGDDPPPDNGEPDNGEPDNGEPEPPQEPGTTREVRVIRAGTSQATEVHILRAPAPGPAVMVTGGVHGSETSGWLAAREIKDWDIDAGTLVVIPEANRPAVLRERRTGPDGLDLNRQFPVGQAPRTQLAREIWDLVLEFQPAALMDLHEGWGVRRLGHRFPNGTLSVGQTLITYPAGDARAFADAVKAYLDHHHVRNQSVYAFMIIGPPAAGSLARKAGAELGIPAFITEPSQYQTRLSTRIRWQKVFVEELLRWYGLLDEDHRIVPKEYRTQAGPVLAQAA